MAGAETTSVLEENVSLALGHFPEDDDVLWVLPQLSALDFASCQLVKTYHIVFIWDVVVVQRLNIKMTPVDLGVCRRWRCNGNLMVMVVLWRWGRGRCNLMHGMVGHHACL
jgi:hypothetical protein